MIELPETNLYWHYNVDSKVPFDKPKCFLIYLDITDPVFSPFWHTQVAAILNSIAVDMMEGEEIPTSLASRKTPENDFGEVIITGDPVEGMSTGSFAELLSKVNVRKDIEGNIHISLPESPEEESH